LELYNPNRAIRENEHRALGVRAAPWSRSAGGGRFRVEEALTAYRQFARFGDDPSLVERVREIIVRLAATRPDSTAGKP